MPILNHWLVYLALAGPAPASVPPDDSGAMTPAAIGADCRIASAPPSASPENRPAIDMPRMQPFPASPKGKTSL